ncbi:hypothetical protein [Christiangramia crocea]|uniref:Uncharacterized protein n=1 Tax=Christiangramia crocea TaxID=2904124 RepID=A0A9X1UVP7_9FLAO|nr:hypothetical protein [Gramella crocea]MCG9971001.1 hypothetical protein [Gramella crocea]
MKKVLLLLVFIGVSCSTDDDCKYDRSEITMQYEAILENDMTPSQRAQIEKEYQAKLDESC